MGSNTDKITQTLEQIFLFMEKLEIDYAATMKSQEEPIMQNSLVSDVDVSTEVSKYTKAQRVHASKANATAEDSYYITTGAV
ncbi:hypothetical protein GW750_00505 [bacterium]|nr:hypothetical protein [bacterium]